MHVRPSLKLTGLIVMVAIGSLAWAQGGFIWSPDQFPEGDQRYVLEIVTGGDAGQLLQLAIDITQTDAGYDAVTTITANQSGLSASDLSGAAFGGTMLGGLAFGPMMFFGPAFMMLPLMLGQQEIMVRDEPIVVMGLGNVYMPSAVEIAGHTCVEIRFEPTGDASAVIEFGLAEGVPFPCYTRFGSGDDLVEMTLIEAIP